MIQLRSPEPDDLTRIHEMEEADDTRPFIIPSSLDRHRSELKKPDNIYLVIGKNDKLDGFIILVKDPDGESIEFRRIVVARKGAGLGQSAIEAMERYCRESLGRKRVWLDVFAANARARHVYEKMGYRRFQSAMFQGQTLLYYQKTL